MTTFWPLNTTDKYKDWSILRFWKLVVLEPIPWDCSLASLWVTFVTYSKSLFEILYCAFANAILADRHWQICDPCLCSWPGRLIPLALPWEDSSIVWQSLPSQPGPHNKMLKSKRSQLIPTLHPEADLSELKCSELSGLEQVLLWRLTYFKTMVKLAGSRDTMNRR